MSVFHVLVYEHYAYCQSNKISHHIPFEYISTYNVFAYRVNNISIIITVLRSIVTIARRKYIFRNIAIAWQLRENPILVCITYCSISVTRYIYTINEFANFNSAISLVQMFAWSQKKKHTCFFCCFGSYTIVYFVFTSRKNITNFFAVLHFR